MNKQNTSAFGSGKLCGLPSAATLKRVNESTIAAAQRGAEMLSRGDDFVEAAAIRELIKAVRDASL